MAKWSIAEDDYIKNNSKGKNHKQIADELKEKFNSDKSYSSVKNRFYALLDRKIKKKKIVKVNKLKEDDYEVVEEVDYKPNRGERAVKSSFVIHKLIEEKKYVVETFVSSSYNVKKTRGTFKKRIMQYKYRDRNNYYFKTNMGYMEAIRIFTPPEQLKLYNVAN